MSIEEKVESKSKESITLDKGPFYHGTKANLEIGDL